MKKVVLSIVMLVGMSMQAFAAHDDSDDSVIRMTAVALDHLKSELSTGVISVNAHTASNTDISIDSLAAAGSIVTGYEVSNDLAGECMVTLTFSSSKSTTKSYRIENKNHSWFGDLCP